MSTNNNDDESNSSRNSKKLTSKQSQQQPKRVLRILTTEEALQCNAICRICFEGCITNDNNVEDKDKVPTTGSDITVVDTSHTVTLMNSTNTSSTGCNNPLIAPCACTGTAEFVHVLCLRRWQRQVIEIKQFNDDYDDDSNSSDGYTNAAAGSVCDVCCSLYTLPPPKPLKLRSDLFCNGGILLVSKDLTIVDEASMFWKSVILMLNSGNDTIPLGLIINKPGILPPRRQQREESQKDSKLIPSNALLRKGGPICGGGSFGTVRNLIAFETNHEIQFSIDNNNNDNNRFGTSCVDHFSSKRIFGNIWLLYNGPLPAVVGSRRLKKIIPILQQKANNLILFSGYCAWSLEQLHEELVRESWIVCRYNTEQEEQENENIILRSDVTTIWDDLTLDSDRLIIPKQELYENMNEDDKSLFLSE